MQNTIEEQTVIRTRGNEIFAEIPRLVDLRKGQIVIQTIYGINCERECDVTLRVTSESPTVTMGSTGRGVFMVKYLVTAERVR